MTENTNPAEPMAAEDDRAYALDRRTIAAILYAVDVGDAARLTALMEPLHQADIADLLEQMNAYDRRRLILLYGPEFDGDILTELEEGIREEVIQLLPRQILADAVRDLDSDDVVDLLEDLEAPEQEAILGALEEADRAVIEQALSYPEYSAGRLMQRECVIAPEFWTVGHAIDHMRASDGLPDSFYHVILVDPRLHPIAQVSLGAIMRSPRDRALRDLIEDQFRTIPVDQYDGDVAYAFNQYHLISAPVVDADGRLVGVITIDDAMSVLDEEHAENILRLAGVGDDSRLSDTVLETLRQRLPWLGVNLFTAALAATVIAQFEATISALVALAALMPIVASMGGNAGTQSLTVAVRALATRDLTAANAWRVVRREMAVGLLNGLSLALPLGLVTWALFGAPLLGAVIGAALVINLFVAALAGVTVPLVMDRLGVDPALASGVFVTTVTDVIGFLAFLGLATLVLL